MRPRAAALPGALAAIVLLAACGGDEPPRTSLVVAGDIASCWWRGDEATARLLDGIDAPIAVLGDLVYQDGSPERYRRCYGPTWGRHLRRTHPVPGNHDYRWRRGEGYFAYFGRRAGEPGKGWYSYRVDGWHVVALNSEEEIGEGSPQLEWLRRDLRAHPTRCTLVYAHRPRFSSGKHGPSTRMDAAFRVMYEHGVDLFLAGHEHNYERFAPQDPEGRPDPARGVRQMVVGTGGAPTYPIREPQPNSEARNDRDYGVLRLVFHPDAYEWEFVPVQGRTYTDRGRASCNAARPPGR